jgi:fatty acid desaturase
VLRLLKDYNENTMEIISEILDLIVEGTLELIGSKKVPMILRIIAGFVLIGLCSGLVGLFVYLGMMHQHPLLIVIGVVLLLFMAVTVYRYIKQHM